MDWTEVAPMFSVGQYFKFFFTLTVALGAVFQLPVAMRALHRVGILKLEMVLRYWRITVLAFFVISAMLTPPDPITQLLMVTPMLLLFVLGLFLMWNADRKAKAATPPSAGGAGA
jgi:Sec-independent protein secretion pathway component TatC